MQNWLGIDYGSKLSGTTAIVYRENNHLISRISAKKQDADQWLSEKVEQLKPEAICIDAPLSLPGVYRYPEDYDDYFYRKADRELKAMSPMFLGGLTARAIRLSNQWKSKGILVCESYPGGLARKLLAEALQYKKGKTQIPAVLEELRKHLPAGLQFEKQDFQNWHQVDALLAWLVGYRIHTGVANCFGSETEGMIWV